MIDNIKAELDKALKNEKNKLEEAISDLVIKFTEYQKEVEKIKEIDETQKIYIQRVIQENEHLKKEINRLKNETQS